MYYIILYYDLETPISPTQGTTSVVNWAKLCVINYCIYLNYLIFDQ